MPVHKPAVPDVSLESVYSKIKDGDFKNSARQFFLWWSGLHWIIRLLVVGLAVGLPMLLIVADVAQESPPGGIVVSVILIPLGLFSIIALARPEPAPNLAWRLSVWAATRRDRAREGGKIRRWFFRPFYASLCGSATLTKSIRDIYVRAGTTFALQFCALCLALAFAYVAIVAVIVIVFLILALWFISLMLSEGFSSSSSSGRSYSYSERTSARRSTKRTDLFGDEYIQHQDASGKNIGYTENRVDIFGNVYQQHLAQDGTKIGTSEDRVDIFGNNYQQHFDEGGNQAGHTESREDIFGDPYSQHYDQQGNKTGYSEVRSDFFGDPYVKHEREDK
jgi:hypothetical protein